MRRSHPCARTDIPISGQIHDILLSASCSSGWQKEDWEVAEEAIQEWVRRHDPESIPMATTRGYQWKSLFLPCGTLLRTVFGGKNHHCIVENDQILHDGQPVSPSGFVNAVGGVRRNAWRSTWILFPDNKHWVLADTMRTRRQRPRQPKAVRATNHPEAMPTTEASPDSPVAPAAGAPPAPVAPVAVRAPDAPCVPASFDGNGAARDAAPSATRDARPSATRDAAPGAPPSLQPHPSMMLSCPSCACGAARTPEWLRVQLQLLLARMFALDDQHLNACVGPQPQAGPR